MSTAFYKYDNIRLKEISIMDAFEQIQENTIAGSAFLARLGSSAVAFIPGPPYILTIVNLSNGGAVYYVTKSRKAIFAFEEKD